MSTFFAGTTNKVSISSFREIVAKVKTMSYFQKLPELYRKLIYFTGLIWTILVIGTAGFKFIQPEFSLFDAFYMTTITLSTVGFQEVNPLGESAKLFTVFLIAIGITTLGYGVSSITSIIVEGQIKNTFRDRKMVKAIKKLKNHIVLCGYGRLGNHRKRA